MRPRSSHKAYRGVLLGLGGIARSAHLPAFLTDPKVAARLHIVAVMDESPAAAAVDGIPLLRRPEQLVDRKVVVVEVRRTLRGPQIMVSRSHKNLVKRLFELEVPEIYHGQVEIVGIAREAGSRTKIAVRARQPGIDARGACIGQRGLRVQAIVNELGGEKIDIIEWNEKPEQYVANALEPAHVVRVDIVADDKTAYVVVPDRQLSLAIGKEGQNARLAAKLTGWRIDIRSESEVRAELEPEPEPEPVAAVVEVAPVVEEDAEPSHDLIAEVEAESAMADEEELDEEDRALLGAKKKKERR